MFSLFSRKDKSSPKKGATPAVRGTDSTLRGPTTAPAATQDPNELQRELARRTALKIDQIESEMIAAALPVPPAPKRVQEKLDAQKAQPAQQGAEPAVLDPMTLPPLDMPGHANLGGSGKHDDIKIIDGYLAPELEEAAILFANGQNDAAAATLCNVMAGGGELAANLQGWRMLFDVYQANRSKAEFEALALDYAARFEQSPPAWQEPDIHNSSSRDNPIAKTRPGGGLGLAMPATLDDSDSVKKQFDMALRAQTGKRTVTLDLSGVRHVTAGGASMLLSLINGYKIHGGALVLSGAAALLDALRPMTQPGTRDGGVDSWMLALEMLRVQGERNTFDDLSIDYCVTFEVSPPTWEAMPENIREPSKVEAAAEQGAPAEVEVSAAPGLGGRGFPLSGEVVGRIQKELSELRDYVTSRSKIVIDCRNLVRLDFVAAGELLNETVTFRAAGKEIAFLDVSAIVAALMSVMGIHELADIRRRKI